MANDDNPVRIRTGRRPGLSLVEVLVVTSLLSLLAALLMPALEGARESASRVRCGNNLRQVGLATNGYLNAHGVFPEICGSPERPGFPKQFSTFTGILPYVEQTALFDAINFDVGLQDFAIFPAPSAGGRSLGWEANSTAMATSLGFLLCPSDGIPSIQARVAGCNYRANFGAGLTFGSDGAIAGPLSWPVSVSAATVTDGLSHTATFSEKLRGEIGRRWLDPRTDMVIGPTFGRYDPTRTLAKCAYQSVSPGQFYTTMGTNWFVGALSQACYNHVDVPNSLEPDCIVPGFNPVAARASARSNHRSGVNVALADGSVRFVGSMINLAAWKALGTRAGGEVDDGF